MAYYNRTQVGLKETSSSVNVPNDPRAELMYYLNCVKTVLKMNDNAEVNRLSRYQNYYTLDNDDVNLLIHLCVLLSPKELINKCFFQNDSLCGDSGNKFYDLETVRNNLLIAGNVAIGGRNRQVTKIMTFKMTWFRNYWETPLTTLLAQQRRMREEAMRRQTAASCVIL